MEGAHITPGWMRPISDRRTRQSIRSRNGGCIVRLVPRIGLCQPQERAACVTHLRPASTWTRWRSLLFPGEADPLRKTRIKHGKLERGQLERCRHFKSSAPAKRTLPDIKSAAREYRDIAASPNGIAVHILYLLYRRTGSGVTGLHQPNLLPWVFRPPKTENMAPWLR